MEVLSHVREPKFNQDSNIFNHSRIHNGTINERNISLPTKSWAPNGQHNVGIQSRKLKRFNKNSFLHSSPTNNLATFKSTPLTFKTNGLLRPYMGQCCSRCMPISRMNGIGSLVEVSTKASSCLGLSNILKTRTENKENSILTKIFAHALYVNAMSREITYSDLSGRVLQSNRVQEAIKKCSEIDFEESNRQLPFDSFMKEHTKRATAAINRMKASFSTILLRIGGWLMLKLLGSLLNGVQVHQGQITEIKNATKKNLPLAFLPTHRSHLDYILVTFILYFNDIRAPYVAAGDNLHIPFFSWLLKCFGGFFIKRKLDPEVGKKDYVYRAVLHTYMQEILRNRENIEFFIEGGRSRTGKPCLPKGGLLSVLVDSCLDDEVEDICIVPVSISYEKILDGNFNDEQMGLIKRKETFRMAVCNIWRALSFNYGSVRVDFGQPFSLREMMQSVQVNNQSAKSPVSNAKLRLVASSASLYGTDIVIDNKTLVKSLANHIAYDSSQMIAVMSTNLLAFLFLNKFRQGASLKSVVSGFDELKRQIIDHDRDVGFCGETEAVVNYASQLLGKQLISKEWTKKDALTQHEENNNEDTCLMKPNTDVPHIFELQYYSNVVVSVFLLESILANSIFALIGHHLNQELIGDHDLHLSKDDLICKAEELCNILQYEFIFAPPCLSLESVLEEALNKILSKEILIKDISNLNCPGEIGWANRLADSLSFDPDLNDEFMSTADQQYRLNTNTESIEKLRFLQRILNPFIEGYWLAAYHLTNLLQTSMEEPAFLRLIHHSAKERLSKGLLTHAESSSHDILQNSLKLFENWKVIENYHHENLRWIQLQPSHCTKDRLHSILMRIDEFKS